MTLTCIHTVLKIQHNSHLLVIQRDKLCKFLSTFLVPVSIRQNPALCAEKKLFLYSDNS